MAIKKVRIRPEGGNNYADILHPETSADVVKFSDGTTVEAHKTQKATQTTLGHVKAGQNITIDSSGTISAKDTITTINGKTGVITKADIVALGIPAQDTTYGIATTSTDGLMSATDKAKLNGIEAGANKTIINDTLTSTSTTQALSARQGKTLKDNLDAHKAQKATQDTLGHISLQDIPVKSVNGKTGEVILSASNVGAVPTSRKVNNKALTSDITIDVFDIPRLMSSDLFLGENAVALDYSVALGMTAVATGYNSVALGRGASAEGGSSVALGTSASAKGTSSVALGASASAAEYAVVLGMNASAEKHSSVVLGRNASATGTYSVVLGRDASAEGNAVAIGMNASAEASASVALGQGTSAEGRFSVALGSNASVSNDNEGVLGGTGVGQTSKWIVPGTFTVNGTKNFEIPHPRPDKKATHVIRHGAVESPTAGDTLYRYKIQATKDNDIVTIDLPDYFIYLNKDVQIWVTGQGHFGNGYGVLNEETEQLEIHCQLAGEYNVLVIGTRNDDHPSVQEWSIKGVEREIGESWTGETYAFSVDEIIEIEEIKEVIV